MWALLPDHVDPSKVNTLKLTLKISRHNKQQLLTYLILYTNTLLYMCHTNNKNFG